MKARYRSILAAILVALTLFTASLAPAGAYYGATDAIYYYDVGIPDVGCSVQFYVYEGKRAQVWCKFINPVNGVRLMRTNYTEYDCVGATYCYYEAYIAAVPGSYPELVSTMMKDDLEGYHTLIMDIGH